VTWLSKGLFQLGRRKDEARRPDRKINWEVPGNEESAQKKEQLGFQKELCRKKNDQDASTDTEPTTRSTTLTRRKKKRPDWERRREKGKREKEMSDRGTLLSWRAETNDGSQQKATNQLPNGRL